MVRFGARRPAAPERERLMATERPRGANGRFVAFAAAAEPTPKARKKSTRLTPRQRAEAGEGALDKHWRTYFLQSLAETSNVKASAAAAGVSPSRAYKVRREDGAFAGEWRKALVEGYEHLELEALGYLRAGDPARKFDVASAIRLLTLHRETVAAERTRAGDPDGGSVLDTIDAVLDQMRRRRAANAALVADRTAGGGDDAL